MQVSTFTIQPSRRSSTVKVRPAVERRLLPRRAASIVVPKKIIPFIPPELVDHILSYVKHDRPTLMAASMVCRMWFFFARPHMLRRVDLVLEWEGRCRSFLVLIHSAENHLLRRTISHASKPPSPVMQNSHLPSFMHYTKVLRLDLNSDSGDMSVSGASVTPLTRLASVRRLQLVHSQNSPKRLESALKLMTTTFPNITGITLHGLHFPSHNVLAEFVCGFPNLNDLTLSDIVYVNMTTGVERLKPNLSLRLTRLCLIVDKKDDMSAIWVIKLKSFEVRDFIVDATFNASKLWESVHAILVKHGPGLEHLSFQRCNNLHVLGLSLRQEAWKLGHLRTLSVVVRQLVRSPFFDKEEHLATTLANLTSPYLTHIYVKLTDVGVTCPAERARERSRSINSYIPSTLSWPFLDETIAATRLPRLKKVTFTLQLADCIDEHTLLNANAKLRRAFPLCRAKGISIDVSPAIRIPWDWDGLDESSSNLL